MMIAKQRRMGSVDELAARLHAIAACCIHRRFLSHQLEIDMCSRWSHAHFHHECVYGSEP